MKIIYVFLIALILSVLAFFLAIRITDSTGAALFLFSWFSKSDSIKLVIPEQFCFLFSH